MFNPRIDSENSLIKTKVFNVSCLKVDFRKKFRRYPIIIFLKVLVHIRIFLD